jgi:hypothetical protein
MCGEIINFCPRRFGDTLADPLEKAHYMIGLALPEPILAAANYSTSPLFADALG